MPQNADYILKAEMVLVITAKSKVTNISIKHDHNGLE